MSRPMRAHLSPRNITVILQSGFRSCGCTKGEAGQREWEGETPGTPLLSSLPSWAPVFSRLHSRVAPHQSLPPPCNLPPVLHVGQQLAQQQGRGLHIHVQDLKSEQRQEGGQRDMVSPQPRACYHKTLGVRSFVQQTHMPAGLRFISLLIRTRGVSHLLMV